MDGTEFSASARPRAEREAAHAALLDAARDALEWFRMFQRHAPEGIRFGGEERLMRRLSAAIETCSFETRGCLCCEPESSSEGRA